MKENKKKHFECRKIRENCRKYHSCIVVPLKVLRLAFNELLTDHFFFDRKCVGEAEILKHNRLLKSYILIAFNVYIVFDIEHIHVFDCVSICVTYSLLVFFVFLGETEVPEVSRNVRNN